MKKKSYYDIGPLIRALVSRPRLYIATEHQIKAPWIHEYEVENDESNKSFVNCFRDPLPLLYARLQAISRRHSSTTTSTIP